MKVCSLAALSQCCKVSWLMHSEAGAEGKLCLATLLKKLLSLAGSGDPYNTLEVVVSFLSVCISYHREVLGIFTNWSLNSPAVSAFLDGTGSTRSLNRLCGKSSCTGSLNRPGSSHGGSTLSSRTASLTRLGSS